MTHKTRKIVKFITLLHYLTNLHHLISNSVKMRSGKLRNLVKVRSTA